MFTNFLDTIKNNFGTFREELIIKEPKIIFDEEEIKVKLHTNNIEEEKKS